MTDPSDQTAGDPGLSHHPSPQRERIGAWSLAFATIGAPVAWFVQLTVNYAIFAQHCFAASERLTVQPTDKTWNWTTAIGVYLACLAIGAAATLVAISLFRRTMRERAGHEADVQESGSGRSRFFAYWAILLGVSFTTVTAVNLLALLTLPPCAL
jgi:hypothetical protein